MSNTIEAMADAIEEIGSQGGDYTVTRRWPNGGCTVLIVSQSSGNPPCGTSHPSADRLSYPLVPGTGDVPSAVDLGDLLYALCPEHDPERVAQLVANAVYRHNTKRAAALHQNTEAELRTVVPATTGRLEGLPDTF